MKSLFFLIYFLLLAINTYSQDYNYEFIAEGVLARKLEQSILMYDTLNLKVRVSKEYDHLIVSDNDNIGQTIYSQTITYIGIQLDGDIIYQGNYRNSSTLFFINPLKKTLKIYKDRIMLAQYGLEQNSRLIPESYK